MTQICNSCWLACVQSQPLCILLCSPYRLYANLWKEHNLDYLKKKFSWMKKGENTFCKRKCYLFKGILASPSFIFIAKKSMFFIRICGFHRTSPILRTAKCGASEFIVSKFGHCKAKSVYSLHFWLEFSNDQKISVYVRTLYSMISRPIKKITTHFLWWHQWVTRGHGMALLFDNLPGCFFSASSSSF